jgi:hypothetical protein
MIIKGNNEYLGSNNLNSLALFEERKEYKLFVSIPQSIDTWNTNPLYGKVDKKRSPVSLSESNLKQYPIEGKTFFGIDFVVDAFKGMKNFYTQMAAQKRVVLQGSIISNLEPKKAWISLNQLYHSHMDHSDCKSNLY